jgi:hypothetical protein
LIQTVKFHLAHTLQQREFYFTQPGRAHVQHQRSNPNVQPNLSQLLSTLEPLPNTNYLENQEQTRRAISESQQEFHDYWEHVEQEQEEQHQDDDWNTDGFRDHLEN